MPMSRFMLDTNTVSYAIRGVENVVQRLSATSPADLCISAITLAELRYGADRRGSKRLHRLIDTILTSLEVVPFDAAVATTYGRVAASLSTTGNPIGMADTQIAAHALTLNMTIVTNNVKHFERVKGLRVEDWS